ncbi:MAG: DUF1223 domain-containing protein [Rhodospirillales bacterium]|nr:DUF1223 domain-containing protein [Rhodospirillales bacterium]
MSRSLRFYLAIAFIGLGSFPDRAHAQTVVELFTSQGCSSCPPADALLARLDERDDVFGLTLAVDYWDYLGWKDRFASPVHTQRQRDYQAFLDNGNVYTPQMVIGGAAQAVGSDWAAVREAIERDKSREGTPLPISIELQDGAMTVTLPAGRTDSTASVWFVLFDHEQEVSVNAGENGGHSLTYRNVVRDFRRIGSWDGRPGKIFLSSKEFSGFPLAENCAVLVQERGTGPIIGVARRPLARDTN